MVSLARALELLTECGRQNCGFRTRARSSWFCRTDANSLSNAVRNSLTFCATACPTPTQLSQISPSFAAEVLERMADRSQDSGAWRMRRIRSFARAERAGGITVDRRRRRLRTRRDGKRRRPAAPRQPAQVPATGPGLPSEPVGGVFITNGFDAPGSPVSASARDFVGVIEHRSFVRTAAVGTNLAHLPGLPDEDARFFQGWRRFDPASNSLFSQETTRVEIGPPPVASDDAFVPAGGHPHFGQSARQ